MDVNRTPIGKFTQTRSQPGVGDVDRSCRMARGKFIGSADIELMRRLVAVLADTPHRYVVSKGPRADEFELPDNMWGEARVPQTNVIPHCDLVITHGGNNTTTEALHFGKPMIVLPLFWDQYDNAQRVHELGFGERLPTYAIEDDQLRSAVDRLVVDADLRAPDGRGQDVRSGPRTAWVTPPTSSSPSAELPRADGQMACRNRRTASGAATAMIPTIHSNAWRM